MGQSKHVAPGGGTWEEPPAKPRAVVPFLVYALFYDDLSADGARAMPWPEGVGTLPVGRTETGPTRAIEGKEIVVADRWASSRHAAFERRSGVVRIVDRQSRNGTFVNGERVSERALIDGDLVEIGHSLFVYREVTEAALATLAVDPPRRFGPTRTLSAEVASLVHDFDRIAPTGQSVLLLGETGVGKEVAARAIHEGSGRSGRFRSVDCGAIPDTLFESTLFGHRRGAFTGAQDTRTGEVVQADGGTLFLDEIGNTSPAAQAKLLRVIEEGRVTPLGASESLAIDVRWIAATNADLAATSSTFRSDLLQRIGAYVGRIPPLRRRREDLGTLAAHILRESGVRASITAPAGRKLFCDGLPGNVRQLRNILRTASALAGDRPIDLAELEPATTDALGSGGPEGGSSVSAPRRAGMPTATEITEVLQRTRGNVVQAARELDAHPRQLYRWIERLALDVESYRR